jgi:uncharacterized protein (TIGR02996 family)
MDPFRIKPPLDTEVIVIPSTGKLLSATLHDGLEIGRAASCEIALDEPWLAPRHVRFRETPEGFAVEALDRSVMFVNHLRYADTPLRVGDVVVAAQTPILFQHRLPAPPWYDAAAELLASIRQHPDDDDERMVFADWLADRDPLRSEFIACQLAAEHGSVAATSRAEQLMCIDIAAPLVAPVVSWTFRRGFVASARLLFATDGAPIAGDHPGCTFTRVDYPTPTLPY